MALEIKKGEIRTLCEKHHIGFLGLFGSHARGDANTESDIDLLVEYKKPVSMFEHVRIQREFSQRLGKQVDLVTKKSVHPYIQEYVEKDLKILYEG